MPIIHRQHVIATGAATKLRKIKNAKPKTPCPCYETLPQ